MRVYFNAIEVVGFNVIDSIEGDRARSDCAGRMDGVIRQILEWETSFNKKRKMENSLFSRIHLKSYT